MESNEHCETVQENNLMHFRDRPLSEALAKYNEDYRFVVESIPDDKSVDVGTFHDWLELDYRPRGIRYDETCIRLRFTI